MKARNILTTALIFAAMGLNAKVKLPSLIGDNMILQQQTSVNLWGEASPNATVKVIPSWNNKEYSCKANNKGEWILKVETPEAGYTPYSVTFDDGEKTIINNVLVGEVWLASGQSNMEMPLKGFGGCCIMNGIEDIAYSAENKGVRMFTVPKRQCYEPQTSCGGQWNMASPSTAGDFSATAYHYATSLSRVLQVPIGIVTCAYGGSSVESWLPKEILQNYSDIPLDKAGIETWLEWARPLLMYNGMLNPVKNYTIKGFIWYQGETNVARYDTYAERFTTMVKHWREIWGQGDIPFYYVDIAPYDYDQGHEDEKSPYLREAQFKAQSMIPNSFMVCINDLVEPYERMNIHPRNKTMVGRRLSFAALNLTYGYKQFHIEHPQYKSLRIEGNTAYVGFDHIGMGICRNYDIQGFEIAGENKVFYPAEQIRFQWETNEFVISSSKVLNPVAVRYCFHDFQIGTIIGGNELPAIPFRTDNW